MTKKLTYEELENKIQELEQKIRLHEELLEKSIDTIWRVDLRLRFTYVSPSIYDSMGYTPEEWTGTKLSSHTTYREFIKMARIAFSIMKGYNKNDVEVFETFLFHKDGTPIDVEVAGKVIFNQNGLPSHILGSTRVITERKKAEQKLESIARQLRESNATKDKFFSIVAHDLKNPFNALMGFSDLLEQEAKKTDNEKIRTYSSLISTTLSRSLDYLNNLLEWSRLQSDKIEFLPVKINLYPLVRETVDVLNVQAESKNITIKIDVPKDIAIVGDANMLKTVLINLISNAIKYSYSDSTIVLMCHREKGKVTFSVKDNGVGIKNEAKERLFLIEEANSTRGTNNEAGTGLGLILCKEFIMKHHGEIGAKSKFGKGSTFWFKIPEK